MAGKISEYTNAVATFANGDLVDVSKRISTSPDVFESQKLEFTQFQAFIQANATNIYNFSGIVGTGRVATLTDTLRFKNGTFEIQGTGTTGSSLLSLYDENGALTVKLWDFLDNGNINLGTNSTINLGNSNTLTIENSGASSNFQINADGNGYFLFNRSGGLKVVPTSAGNDSIVCRNVADTVDVFNVEKGGGGYWNANGGINIGADDGVTDFANFSIEALNFYANGSLKHQIGFKDANDDVFFHVNGSLPGRYFIIGSQTPISNEAISLQGSTLISKKLELSTTTDGILLPRLTTAEKDAISTPDLNLVVFDTTLNSLQRWNGLVWVALASGFGLIEVFRSGDNGEPNFFSDLQSALETCKASGSRNYVKIYGNITLTSGISMSYEGSGTGNGYLYESLTLDLNGFTITNNQTDNSKVIYNRLNGASLNILNGSLIRTNGNGVDFSLYAEHNSSSSLTLNNVTVYCENGWAGYLVNVSNINLTSFKNFCDFGGSLFISDSGARQAIITSGSCSIENFTTVSSANNSSLSVNATSKARNFKSISTGSGHALDSFGEVTMFYSENTGTGEAVRINGGEASHFTAKSVSDYAVNIGNNPNVTYFTAKSITGVAILANSGGRIENAEATSGSSSYTCWVQNGGNMNSVKSENTGTGNAFFLQTTQSKSIVFTDLTGIALSDSACVISLSNAGGSTSLYNSTMQSNLDTSSGHSINITNNTGSVDISTCVLKVKNSGANNITGATTSIDSANNTLVGATTPINATITVNASTDLGNGNRQY